METELENDRLGKVGEDKFSMLCRIAGFTCNRSTGDDVHGWDFALELPLPTDNAEQPLDQQQIPHCWVQVKTTTPGNAGRVGLTLSAAKRLATKRDPALIAVLEFSADGEEARAGYLIHLIDKPLDRVLKRLRKAQAQNRLRINKAKIYFKYRKHEGKSFALTGSGLRAAIEGVCGTDPWRYTLKKKDQLEHSGYNENRLSAIVGFRLQRMEDLGNILLGLAPVRVERVDLFETRFGIALPYKSNLLTEGEEVTFQARPAESCSIAIRGAGVGRAAMFTGDVHVAPPVEGMLALLIRHREFTIKIEEHLEQTMVEMKSTEGLHPQQRMLEEWIVLVRALSHLASGNGVVTVRFCNTRNLEIPITGLQGLDPERLSKTLTFLEAWQEFLERAGVRPAEPFSMKEIYAARSAQMAVSLIRCAGSGAGFELLCLEGLEQPESVIEALCFGSAVLADAAVCYAARMNLVLKSDATYTSEATTLLDVRPLVEDLQAYAKDRAEDAGIALMVNVDDYRDAGDS